MLVICCGMLRSGSTLQYNIAAHLARLATGSTNVSAGYGLWNRIDQLREFSISGDAVLIVKEHHFLSHAMETAKLGQYCCFLYSFRDVRDVLVSLYQKGGLLSSLNTGAIQGRARVESILRRLLYDFAHWTRQKNVLLSRYEEVVADIQREVNRTASHLKLAVSAADIARTAEQVSLKKHMDYVSSINFKAYGDDPVVVDRYDPLSVVDRYDPISLLHENHFNGGECGKWKNELSRQNVEFIESIAGDWLHDNGYAVDSRDMYTCPPWQ